MILEQSIGPLLILLNLENFRKFFLNLKIGNFSTAIQTTALQTQRKNSIH